MIFGNNLLAREMERIIPIGYELADEKIDIAFVVFKELEVMKKEIFDEDTLNIIEKCTTQNSDYMLDEYYIASRKGGEANVRILLNQEYLEALEKGDGPVHSAFKAVMKMSGRIAIALSEKFLFKRDTMSNKTATVCFYSRCIVKSAKSGETV